MGAAGSSLERENDGSLADSLYRAIVDTAVDAIVVIDRNGTIRSVNHATEGLFGYASEELIGRNVKILMPEPYAGSTTLISPIICAPATRRSSGSAAKSSGDAKTGRCFRWTFPSARRGDGDEPIFVGIIRDITDRKAAELAQRESELRLRSIIDTVPDAIVVIDARGTIQSFSPAAERLFGYA